jgi:hypothetical protein
MSEILEEASKSVEGSLSECRVLLLIRSARLPIFTFGGKMIFVLNTQTGMLGVIFGSLALLIL